MLWEHRACARKRRRERRRQGWALRLALLYVLVAPCVSAGDQLNVTELSTTEAFVEQLGWQPRAWLYHNFLTDEECEHLKLKARCAARPHGDTQCTDGLAAQATPRLERSSVVDNNSGKSVDSEIRTSSGMFFTRGEDAVVSRIEERIAAFAMVPVDHGEGIQVLRYQSSQKYEAHFDYFHDDLNTQNGGQRVATVLMYLSDVEEGGETTFPSAASGKRASGELSPCARKGLAVKPMKGNAVLFWSLALSGNTDTSSLHASCPVLKGTKWTATKWLRVGKIAGV